MVAVKSPCIDGCIECLARCYLQKPSCEVPYLRTFRVRSSSSCKLQQTLLGSLHWRTWGLGGIERHLQCPPLYIGVWSWQFGNQFDLSSEVILLRTLKLTTELAPESLFASLRQITVVTMVAVALSEKRLQICHWFVTISKACCCFRPDVLSRFEILSS